MQRQERIATVRAFNRFWMRRSGALQHQVGDTPYSLTEARVVFEIAQRELTPMADLREELEVDPGYLSRLISRLRDQGILITEADPEDARRQSIRLSAAGRRAYEELDTISDSRAAHVLDVHSRYDQQRMVEAMNTLLDIGPSSDPTQIELRAPLPGEYGWVIERHGAIYAAEMGWDVTFEMLVTRLVLDFLTDHDPATERSWIAAIAGDPVGSVFCTRKDAETAQLRMLLVEPATRGIGVGSRLVAECVSFARSADYARIVLRTNVRLQSAQRLYVAAGFELVEEVPDTTFVGAPPAQIWSLAL